MPVMAARSENSSAPPEIEIGVVEHYPLLDGIEGVYYGNPTKEKVIREIEQEYTKRRLPGTFIRDSYAPLGGQDDAMIVTEELFYGALLKQHENEFESDYFADEDYDAVKPENFIRRKWVVVVEYHN